MFKFFAKKHAPSVLQFAAIRETEIGWPGFSTAMGFRTNVYPGGRFGSVLMPTESIGKNSRRSFLWRSMASLVSASFYPSVVFANRANTFPRMALNRPLNQHGLGFNHLPRFDEHGPKITIFGIGGGGGAVWSKVIDDGSLDVELIHMFSDEGASQDQGGYLSLNGSSDGSLRVAPTKHFVKSIQDRITGTDLLYLTAAMGGDTGALYAPVIAAIARDMGIFTVGAVSLPSLSVDTCRMEMAKLGVEQFSKSAKSMIVLSSQEDTKSIGCAPVETESGQADDLLFHGGRIISNLLSLPGFGFDTGLGATTFDLSEDICNVLSLNGRIAVGYGVAEGDDRALAATRLALDIAPTAIGANGALIEITGGPDATLFEIDEAANRLRAEFAPDANIIFGSNFEDKMSGQLRVSFIASGLSS